MSNPVMPDRLRMPDSSKSIKAEDVALAVNAALREVRAAFQAEIKSLKDRVESLEGRVEELENA